MSLTVQFKEEIEIDPVCWECGATLECRTLNNGTHEIKPCPRCLEDRLEEGNTRNEL